MLACHEAADDGNADNRKHQYKCGPVFRYHQSGEGDDRRRHEQPDAIPIRDPESNERQG